MVGPRNGSEKMRNRQNNVDDYISLESIATMYVQRTRVTRLVCEKVSQNVAKLIDVKITAQLVTWKKVSQ
jgi:hypothetical protein